MRKPFFYLFLYSFFLAGILPSLAQKNDAKYFIHFADSIIFIKPDSSALLAKRGIEEAFAENNDTLAGKAYHIIGTAEGIQGHYAVSLENLFNALKIFEKLNLLKRQSPTLTNIAGVIKAQERYAEALKYLKRALLIDMKIKSWNGVASDFQDMGVIYRQYGKLDSALYYLNLSMNFANSKNSSEKDWITASSQYNIAYIYSLQGNYEEARILLNKAITYYQKQGDEYAILHGMCYKANLEYLTDNYGEAIEIAKKGLDKSRKMRTDEITNNFLKILSDSYEASNDYAEALKYFKEYKTGTDSVYNSEKARIVADLQYTFETNKKDEQIQTLKEKEAHNTFIIAIISIAAVAFLFLLINIFLSKKLQKLRFQQQEASHTAEHEIAQREKIQLESEKRIEEEKGKLLQLALESSQREMEISTTFIHQKNKLLEELEEKLTSLSEQLDQKPREQLIELSKTLTEARLLTEDDWEKFRLLFEKAHPNFFVKLRHQFSNLTAAEIRLMALTHLNLGTKEIAAMLGISDKTVYKTRQRLRAKIGRSPEEGLDEMK